jgi:SWI/SNF-related matrix-associated actin-dependent regulator of chromatin subfamily A3
MKSRWYSPNSQLSSIKCVQIASIAKVLTTCPKKIADVLDKEGSEYLTCLLFPHSLTIYFYRIPYVRFDGKMSAKRRQETLEIFSVPLGEDTSETVNIQSTPIASTSEGQQTRRSARTSRRSVASAGEHQEADAMLFDNGDDDEFVPQMDADSDDGIGHDGLPTQNKKSKGKGKGKAKGKSKAAARSDFASVGIAPMNGINPKVMLISLKAGALGLNLTVANNIYL